MTLRRGRADSAKNAPFRECEDAGARLTFLKRMPVDGVAMTACICTTDRGLAMGGDRRA